MSNSGSIPRSWCRGVGSLSQPRLNIFTVGNMRVMICLGQGGLRSLSTSSYILIISPNFVSENPLTPTTRAANEHVIPVYIFYIFGIRMTPGLHHSAVSREGGVQVQASRL